MKDSRRPIIPVGCTDSDRGLDGLGGLYPDDSGHQALQGEEAREMTDPDLLRSPLSYLVTGLRDDGTPGKLTYPLYALLHPMNVLFVSMATVVGLLADSVLFLPAALGIEALVVSVLPRLRPYRKRVDKLIAEIDEAEAAKERQYLLLRIGEGHRRELHQLEHLVGRTRHFAERNHDLASVLLHSQVELDQLLDAYLRLAVVFRERSVLRRMITRENLEEEIAQLEEELEGAASPSLQRLLRQRLDIVRRRAGHWRRTDETLQMIGQQMATINHIVRLLYAFAVSPGDLDVTSRELERFMGELEETERILSEVVEMDGGRTEG